MVAACEDNRSDMRPVRLKVLRQAAPDCRPHWSEYRLQAGRYDRVLDLLNTVKWTIDDSLAFRRSCGHGICGSCAMRINGENRLACKELVWGMGDTIKVQPLPKLDVLRDLVVNMDPVYAAYKRIKPYVTPPAVPTEREQVQTPAQYSKFAQTARCIMCAACTTACPVYHPADGYLGAGALVQAHRFLFDSRADCKMDRLTLLDTRQGVWSCRAAFACTAACPQEIGVSQVIAELQREIIRTSDSLPRNPD